MSRQDRIAQLMALLNDAESSGDDDKIIEIKSDIFKEFGIEKNMGGMMSMDDMTMPLGYQEGTRDGNLVGDKEAMIKAFNLAKANNPDERFSDKDFFTALGQDGKSTGEQINLVNEDGKKRYNEILMDPKLTLSKGRFSNTEEDQMTGDPGSSGLASSLRGLFKPQDPQEEQIKASEDKAAIMSKRNEIIGVLNRRVEELSLSPEKAAEIINSITGGGTPDLGLINQLHDDIVIQDQEFKKIIEQEKMAREQEIPAMNRGGVMNINSLTRRI